MAKCLEIMMTVYLMAGMILASKNKLHKEFYTLNDNVVFQFNFTTLDNQHRFLWSYFSSICRDTSIVLNKEKVNGSGL